MIEKVILVNEQDEAIGSAEKMEAHHKALLHRAFSIFIFNQQGQMLLQQRANTKYHSSGLWTNACCGHPRPDEKTHDAALRRLNEEIGIVCEIKHAFTFTYKAILDSMLTEHEIDHVFFGNYNGVLQLNPKEVKDIAWVSISDLEVDVQNNPRKYTAWFKICLAEVLSKLK